MIYVLLVALLADWFWLLVRLRRHVQLVPVNRPLTCFPVVANLYLRAYLFIDRPQPGTASAEVKAQLRREAACGAVRASVEQATIM